MQRDTSIDVVRATYIIMMIFYHCFSQTNSLAPGYIMDINRYLVLVSGSFPFLAGFLIGHHYLDRSYVVAADTASRLFLRGLRLLLIYLVTNVLIIYLFSVFLIEGVVASSDSHFQSIFTVNASEVIYDILVPLGLILLVGAVLVYMARMTQEKFRDVYYVISALGGIVLAIDGSYPYMACGLIGLALGHSVIETCVMSVYARFRSIVLLSLVYGLALSIYTLEPKASGILYVLGVITLFYAVRSFKILSLDNSSSITRELILYSRYSLFIYLVHVPFLIILVKQKIILISELPPGILFGLLLLIVFISMSLIIRVVEHLRSTSSNFKKIYGFVFG